MKNTQRGFIVPLLLVIIALLLAGGGTYLYTQKKSADEPVTGNAALPQPTNVAPASAQAVIPTPHIISAAIVSGVDSEYIEILGTGFTPSSQVYISGHGFSGFVSTNHPNSSYPAEDSTNGTKLYLTTPLPATYKQGFQYDVYVSNGDRSVSNTIMTATPSQG